MQSSGRNSENSENFHSATTFLALGFANRKLVPRILPHQMPYGGHRGTKQRYFEQVGWGRKTINTKHINIFLTALAGESSQRQTGTRPREKRDKMTILLWNSAENGQFVPGTGPGLSEGRVLFVPGTVPVCPGHRPAQRIINVYWFYSCLSWGQSAPLTAFDKGNCAVL